MKNIAATNNYNIKVKLDNTCFDIVIKDNKIRIFKLPNLLTVLKIQPLSADIIVIE